MLFFEKSNNLRPEFLLIHAHNDIMLSKVIRVRGSFEMLVIQQRAKPKLKLGYKHVKT